MRHRRANPLIAVKNDSTLLTDLEVVAVIPSLQRQISEHFEPAWGIGAQLVFAEKRVPRHAYQIHIVDEATSEEDAGYLGYHFQSDGSPAATLFAREDLLGNGTISETMSHEILEMLVDPAVNLYAYRPAGRGRRERGYFYEVCDAVQTEHYKIDGVEVCDFVYPQWYEHNWPPGSRRFDHLGRLEEPFQILPGCYADVREVGVGWRTIWGSKKIKKSEYHRRNKLVRERNVP
jgi:hypothetical protein